MALPPLTATRLSRARPGEHPSWTLDGNNSAEAQVTLRREIWHPETRKAEAVQTLRLPGQGFRKQLGSTRAT